ncbi:MAG: hypothetical protein H8E54_02595 [Candidatus Aminicenantes bacterium]|nr:hypothetical protein [Candidatus Aminicenantes bacterium]
MKMEIMFDDLTTEAQERLLDEASFSKPEDTHWDTSPVSTTVKCYMAKKLRNISNPCNDLLVRLSFIIRRQAGILG